VSDRRLPAWTSGFYGCEEERDRCEPWLREHVDPIIEDGAQVARLDRALYFRGGASPFRLYIKFDDAGKPIGYYDVLESVLRVEESEPALLPMTFFEAKLRGLIGKRLKG
jgi:hypothetical protein